MISIYDTKRFLSDLKWGINIRRDKLEIIRNILQICRNGGATKTKIVYQANLNFKTAGIYLDWLIKHDLVNREENSFRMTPKGAELLSNLQDVTIFLNGI